MEFKPDSQLIFSYQENKHLPVTLTLRNNSNTPLIFKFKASTPHKFSIKPNPGLVKQGEELKVLVVAHRDIVENIENEQIQILYGVKEYSESRSFNFILENGSRKDQLNLTMMVQQKQARVKQLQQEVGTYNSMPKKVEKPKKSSKILMIAITGIIGLVAGYFVPFDIFA